MTQYFIENMEGILMYKDEELCYFKISNKELIDFKHIGDRNKYPYELKEIGLSYYAFNEFFKDRVVRDGSQWIKEYLQFLEMEFYDFETIVKKNNGFNTLNFYWVKYKNFGAQSYKELIEIGLPIKIK